MEKEIEMRQEGKRQKKIELFSAFVVLLFVLCAFMPIASAQTTQAGKDKTNSTLEVRTLTYNDFDELDNVCTYDKNCWTASITNIISLLLVLFLILKRRKAEQLEESA